MRFLSISNGSCAEVKNILYILLKVELIQLDLFQELFDLVDRIQRKIKSFMRHLHSIITRSN
jgi:four helix bundle protein